MARRRSAPLTGVIVMYPDGSPAGLRSRHLLLLPSTVGPRDVGALLRARVPTAHLETTGIARLGRHCRISGPFELSMEDAVDAAVPMPWTLAYALDCPVERDDPPAPGEDDRDGLAWAFPDGMPWHDEAVGLQLLVGLARRLRGAVRVSRHGDGGPLIQPDPERSVDVIIHSPVWLEPQMVHEVVDRLVPGAKLAVDGHAWRGPSDAAYTGEALADALALDPLNDRELAALHHVADEFDLATMRSEAPLDAYAVVAEITTEGLPYGADGAVEVLVHVAEPGEPSVADQPWGAHPFVTYEVRWACPEPEERERRLPASSYLACRERTRPLIAAVARSMIETTGGVATDEEGFPLDRYQL